MQALQQEGFMTPESYEHKARYLRQEGAVAEAGVGITIADVYPFRVTDMREGGPAQKTAVIRVGDDLQKVDGKTLQPHLSGAQVRALGPPLVQRAAVHPLRPRRVHQAARVGARARRR